MDNDIIKKIQITGQIAKGENANILEAKWEGLTVAVKDVRCSFDQILPSGQGQKLKDHFLRECRLSSRIRHPNVVRFLGVHFPPDTNIPYIVFERLHCNLNDLLERHSVIPLEIKLRILHGIGLGLRYLHIHDPPIIHKDLTSENVLLSEGIEVKIADLCTARLFPSNCYARVNHSLDFLPPMDDSNNEMRKEDDVFSFGCIMIHTFSQQWPTPSQALVTSNDPDEQAMADSSSELDRRSQYINKVPDTIKDVVLPLIASCLENDPVNRPTAEEVCDQLETLVVNRKCTLPDNLLEAHLVLQETQQKVEQQAAELNKMDTKLSSKNSDLQDQTVELQAVNLELSQLKLETSQLHLFSDLPPRRVSKSSVNFWNSIKLDWKPCTDLPIKCFVTSVAELEGKVYVSIKGSQCAYLNPLVYMTAHNRWSELPPLSYARFSLCAIPSKNQLLAIGGAKVTDGIVDITSSVYSWNESDNKWVNIYPDMPTSRYGSFAVCYQSTVVVAGGVTNQAITRAVEVLHVNKHAADSYWSVVEQLPHGIYEAIPLIIDDRIYIAAGNDKMKGGYSTCSVISALLSDLLQSSNTTDHPGGQVWKKIPDMPYCSYAINHYGGYLITFTGDCMVELPDEDNAICKLIPLMHLFNPDTDSWEYVDNVTHGYFLGRSIHLSPNKIFFIGGLTGKHYLGNSDDLVTKCLMLTITSAAK